LFKKNILSIFASSRTEPEFFSLTILYGTNPDPSPAPACMILTRTYLLVFFPSYCLFLAPLSSPFLLPLKEHWLISPSAQGITVYWDIHVLVRKK
jgi:hypothetical protein